MIAIAVLAAQDLTDDEASRPVGGVASHGRAALFAVQLTCTPMRSNGHVYGWQPPAPGKPMYGGTKPQATLEALEPGHRQRPNGPAFLGPDHRDRVRRSSAPGMVEQDEIAMPGQPPCASDLHHEAACFDERGVVTGRGRSIEQ